MRHSFTLTILLSITLLGCKSEVEKAFDTATATNDLNALREFAAAYDSTMTDKIRQKYELAYESLLKDSTLYSSVNNALSSLQKYNAAVNYINVMPNGIHINEVKVIAGEVKDVAEVQKTKLEEVRKVFKSYKFVEDGETYIFSAPDDSGCGELLIIMPSVDSESKEYTISVPLYTDTGNMIWFARGQLTMSCDGSSYYIDDDNQIVVNYNLKRIGYSIEYNNSNFSNQVLLQKIKSQYKSSRTRKMILNLSVYDNVPILKGKEKGKEGYIHFEEILM